MSVLRNMILEVGAHVEEKISYQIPFFHCFGALCYLSTSGDGVYIGFVRGHELSDDHGLLERKDRKLVRSIHFDTPSELEQKREVVRQILNEAAILNEYHFRRKKKKQKK